MTTHKSFSILTALTALACCFTPVAEAQHRTSISPDLTLDNPATGSVIIGQRLARALASPLAQEKQHAYWKRRSSTRTSTTGSSTSTPPALLTIYSEDPEEPCRLAAVVALHAIGEGASLKLLRHLVRSQTSRRVQIVTLGALVDYFGLEALEGAADMAALAESLLESQRGHRAKSPMVVATRH